MTDNSNKQETEYVPKKTFSLSIVKTAEKQFGPVSELFSDLICVVTKQGVLLEASLSHESVLGYPAKDIIGTKVIEHLHPDDHPIMKKALHTIFTTNKIHKFQFRYKHENGTCVYCHAQGVSFKDSDSSEVYALIILKDISEQQRSVQVLNDIKSVIESSPVVLFIWDYSENFPAKFVTENIKQFGYEASEFISGKRLFQSIVHKDDIDRITKELETYAATNIDQFKQEYRIITIDGAVRWIEDQTMLSRNKAGHVIYAQGVLMDITERKKAEKLIIYNALHDTLTKLPNRDGLHSELHIYIDNAKRNNEALSLLFLDIDNFKEINDLLGHSYGDQLLQMITKRLKTNVVNGGLLARVSGDEFVLVLPGYGVETCVAKKAEEALKQFDEPFVIEGHEFSLSSSIGIAIYPHDGEDKETLIKNADTAMFAAKNKGKNNYQFYSKEMSEVIFKRKKMEIELRQALENNEFKLYYQPQIDLNDGSVMGMEALIRWEHPERGIVSPAEFIPFAEETGIIVSIGEWVLRKACQQNKKWHEQGFTICVKVNLSASQFYQSDLIKIVTQILAETGLDPQFLELEVTESIMMKNMKQTVTTLKALKNIGIKIAIDDFGTGFSSLSYLKQFPIDTLKIDKSFIWGLFTDEKSDAIVSAIINLAENLQLKCIAEGVETPEQLSYLLKNKHIIAQGYLFSQPLPFENLESQFSALQETAATKISH